jgi:hypothetical protein
MADSVTPDVRDMLERKLRGIVASDPVPELRELADERLQEFSASSNSPP